MLLVGSFEARRFKEDTMDRSLLKKRAKEHLKDNWVQAIFGFAIVLLISCLCGLLFIDFRFRFIIIIYTFLLPIYIGYARLHYTIGKDKKASVAKMFPIVNGKEYGRSLFGIWTYTIFLIGWTLLLIVPGIYKAFSYGMSLFIMQDREFSHLNGYQAITKSREYMNGHKLEYFDLLVSFIGWYLLVIVTVGLAAFYVIPYVQQAKAEFYLELKKENN